VLQAARWKYRT